MNDLKVLMPHSRAGIHMYTCIYTVHVREWYNIIRNTCTRFNKLTILALFTSLFISVIVKVMYIDICFDCIPVDFLFLFLLALMVFTLHG